jgi:hypothetical protein
MSITNLGQKSAHIKCENITLKGEPVVFLSEQVWDKIKYLCRHINTVEWSGCIFYKFLSDKPILSNVTTLDIEVVDIIPLDKGTTGFTEYNFDSRVVSYMTEMDYFDLKIGHCHSHHDMKTFFSGTDMSELNDNSEFIKPYLSLIVNNHHTFSCKLAFRVETEPVITYKYQDVNGEWTKMMSMVDNAIKVAAYDCVVAPPKVPLIVSGRFLEQFEQIMKPKPQTNVKLGFNKYQVEQTNLFEDTFDWNNGLKNPVIMNDEESDDNPTLRELELMSCCILRLGQKMNNDSIETTLEDIENSINQRQMNLEKYVKQICNNIKRYISQYWETDITDEELEMFTGDFIDELIFLQDEFPFVQDIILEFDKSIL